MFADHILNMEIRKACKNVFAFPAATMFQQQIIKVRE